MRMCKIMYLNSFYNTVAYNVNVILFQYFSQKSPQRGARWYSSAQGHSSSAAFFQDEERPAVRWDLSAGEGRRSLALAPPRVDLAHGR